MTNSPIIVDLNVAHELIDTQFPQWKNLSLRPVDHQGWDNRTFRLGDHMLVRLPSSAKYESQVQKEHRWLPILRPKVSLTIPQPIALGKPTENYPWDWSIYKWLDGKSANSIVLNDSPLEKIAQQLADFLITFHKIDIADGPIAGLHNWWRGAHISVYDEDTRKLIHQLQNVIDAKNAISLWEKALHAKWQKDSVWVHGDIASGNILIKDNKISAIIDFGCMGIGDPACDLTIAWTFFKNKSRELFKNVLALDSDTWARARGWTLWKALYELSQLDDKLSVKAIEQKRIIEHVLKEHASMTRV